MKNDERDERKTRKVLVPLATLAVAAAVAVGSGATWTSTSSSSLKVTSGTIAHTNSGNGMTLEVTGLVPGKTATGDVVIENTGDVKSVLTLKRTGQSSNFEQLSLTMTDVATGTTYVTGPFPSTADTTEVPLDTVFNPAEAHRYRFAIALANPADNDQGKTAKATYDFIVVPADSANPVTNWIPGLQ